MIRVSIEPLENGYAVHLSHAEHTALQSFYSPTLGGALAEVGVRLEKSKYALPALYLSDTEEARGE